MTTTKAPAGTTLARKLELYVDRSGGLDACHEWTRSRDADGYGQVSEPLTRKVLDAHVVAFEEHHGHPPEGQVRHTCDNPPCCNGRHLIDGTQADNSRDMVERGRHGGGGVHRRPSAGRVALILALTSLGLSQADIARRLGSCRMTIRRVQRGQWAGDRR